MAVKIALVRPVEFSESLQKNEKRKIRGLATAGWPALPAGCQDNTEVSAAHEEVTEREDNGCEDSSMEVGRDVM